MDDEGKFKPLVKIGYTEGDVNARRLALSNTTSAPAEFECYAKAPAYSKEADKDIHKLLDSERYNPKREFFKMTPEEAFDKIKVLYKAFGLDSEVVRTHAISCNALEDGEVKTAERKPGRVASFSFSLAGLHEGDKIYFKNDSSIAATILNDREVTCPNYPEKDSWSLSKLTERIMDSKHPYRCPSYWTDENNIVLTQLRTDLTAETEHEFE